MLPWRFLRDCCGSATAAPGDFVPGAMLLWRSLRLRRPQHTVVPGHEDSCKTLRRTCDGPRECHARGQYPQRPEGGGRSQECPGAPGTWIRPSWPKRHRRLDEVQATLRNRRLPGPAVSKAPGRDQKTFRRLVDWKPDSWTFDRLDLASTRGLPHHHATDRPML